MESTIKMLRIQIDGTRAEIEPLTARLRRLEDDLNRLESLHFISEKGITANDVELSDGEGKPWFFTIDKFSEWLNMNSNKRWAGWNGRIYLAKDLVAGSIPDTKARTADLPSTQPATIK